ncbi:MAG: hypothetical protein ACRD0P_09470 [Stackebrandtia sp.]
MSDVAMIERPTVAGRMGNLAWRALKIEARGYQSMYRMVFRRPRVPDGAVGFGYHRNVLMVLIVFVVVSAIELVVVDLIVRQWPVVRIIMLVLGIWGVVYMLGMLCGMLTRPHSIGPKGLRVRDSTELDIDLPWRNVHAVEWRERTETEKKPKLTADNGAVTFHVRVQRSTNIDVELDEPLTLRLPHGTETVDRIAFYVDDPKDYMNQMRTYA